MFLFCNFFSRKKYSKEIEDIVVSILNSREDNK